MFIFISFIVWRTIDILTSLITPHLIPFLGFFPYKELLADYKLPVFLSSFANFDGTQYLTLVREGYNTYTQAYFPLYFLIVRAASVLFPMLYSARLHNNLIASLFVSNLSFLIGLFLFNKFLLLLFPKEKTSAKWIILFLLLFPTSFFFGAVYTEGLFFLLFIGSLLFLHKKNYWAASLFAILASATRFVGIFLLIPFLFHFINLRTIGYWKLKKIKFDFKVYYITIISPLLGLGAYMIYLWRTVKDPLFFFNAQPVFGANRSTHLILLPQVYYRYFKILFTAQWNFQYFISLIEVIFFTFILIFLCLDFYNIIKTYKTNRQSPIANRFFYLLSLNVFSFINLVLPTFTGTFSSIPRYALMSISAFIFLGQIKNKTTKVAFLGTFLILHIILLGFFIQGYFVG